MKNTFDKDLKQRLEEASMSDGSFAFDKEKLWNRIGEKKKSRKIIFLPWLSHAAAVAAGLAVGFFLFVQEKEKPNTASNTMVQAQPQQRPSVQVITDTVYLAKAPESKAVQTAEPAAKQVRQTTGITPEAQPVPDIARQLMATPERTTLAANVRRPAKVLHLADMGNENASPGAQPNQGLAILKILKRVDLSETNKETFSMMIDKKLRSQN